MTLKNTKAHYILYHAIQKKKIWNSQYLYFLLVYVYLSYLVLHSAAVNTVKFLILGQTKDIILIWLLLLCILWYIHNNNNNRYVFCMQCVLFRFKCVFIVVLLVCHHCFFYHQHKILWSLETIRPNFEILKKC